MPNKKTRLERAKAFESNHGCGSIGGCSICLRDFATQECAALEQENSDLHDNADALERIILREREKIESLTAQLAAAREAFHEFERIYERMATDGVSTDEANASVSKLKAAIEAAGGVE